MLKSGMDSSNKISIKDLEVSNSKEYGALKTVISVAKDLGLDKMIYSKKTPWSENALAMIAGK